MALETLRLSSLFAIISADNETNVRWKDMCDAGYVTYGCEEESGWVSSVSLAIKKALHITLLQHFTTDYSQQIVI